MFYKTVLSCGWVIIDSVFDKPLEENVEGLTLDTEQTHSDTE